MTAACVTNTKLAIAKRAEQHFEKSMACSDAATMDRKNTFLRANGVLISSYYRSLACKTDALPAMHRMSDRNAMAVLPPVSSPLGTLSTYTSVITSYGSLPEAQVRRYCLGECQDAYHATEMSMFGRHGPLPPPPRVMPHHINTGSSPLTPTALRNDEPSSGAGQAIHEVDSICPRSCYVSVRHCLSQIAAKVYL